MSKNLVIVESPSKAKTITKYLGSDYTVMASIGHIKDLPMKDLGVDVDNNFEPTYEVIPEERRKFLIGLRGEAYIKINETYRPLVSPILSAEAKPDEKKPTK